MAEEQVGKTQQPQQQIIRLFTSVNCPHCSKEVILSLVTFPLTISDVMKIEDIEINKNKIKEALDKTIKSTEEKDAVRTWLDKEGTIVDNNDVKNIIAKLNI